MNAAPHFHAVMGTKPATLWEDLREELDRWAEIGRIAGFWWRDDDAVEVTPRLDRLLSLADRVPIGLAVIPSRVERNLAEALSRLPWVAVLQHGWCHTNHAQQGKKSEYPFGRSTGEVATELTDGRTRLVSLFGSQALSIFVPPWNRFAPEFVPFLPDAGINGLSTMAQNRDASLPPGIAGIDVHVDLTAWRDGGGFIGTDNALTRIFGELHMRRLGTVPASEEIGILTHHLIMDDPTADFIRRLCAIIDDHRAARWVAPAEMLPA
jgi:hypothetical protein